MPAVVVAAVLAVLYLVLDPPSADLAAQTYRVGLFGREGFAVWDNHWYGGHHLPGYSVLFPALGSWLGLPVVGAASIVGATAVFTRLVESWLVPARAATAASAWFAAGMTAAVVSGRLAFALGAAVGTAGVLAAARGRTACGAALGVLTALASPVAALFAALVGAALWLERRTPAPAALAAGAVLSGGLLGALFPEGGSEPFAGSAFWPALAAALLAVAAVPRALRAGIVLYALLLAAAFALDTPLGGNATRLGALLGGPLAVGLLWRRPRLLALAALPLAYWALYPPVRDVAGALGDPARAAGYYAPLLARLPAAPPGRLEIPFTAGHWESARVAPSVPLARGWERQLDRRFNAVFYEGRLTAARYGAWLRDNAVRWVALPDAALDASAEAEARLIRAGLPYLRETWRGRHWRLFAVTPPPALGAIALGHDWFTTRGGVVRLRWTPYWAIVEGRGCVGRAPGGWTAVTPRAGGGPVRVAIRFDPLRAVQDAVSSEPRCR